MWIPQLRQNLRMPHIRQKCSHLCPSYFWIVCKSTKRCTIWKMTTLSWVNVLKTSVKYSQNKWKYHCKTKTSINGLKPNIHWHPLTNSDSSKQVPRPTSLGAEDSWGPTLSHHNDFANQHRSAIELYLCTHCYILWKKEKIVHHNKKMILQNFSL